MNYRKFLEKELNLQTKWICRTRKQKKENENSDMIARLAKQMINNADVVLRTDKLISEGKLNKESTISKIVGENSDERIHQRTTEMA